MITREKIIKNWKEKNSINRKYIHFDKTKNALSPNIENYVTNCQNIEKHSFYPFLRIKKIFKKFNIKNPNRPKVKEREITYSSHIDRLIYSYYSQIINEHYNEYLLKMNFNDNIIAYRSNLKKNNIHFAKEAFEKIQETTGAFVIIGDFSNFFDNLDHKYLKKQICKVLNKKKLCKPWYIIFRNITKYHYCELKSILRYLKISKNELQKKDRICSSKKFRKYIDEKKIQIHPNTKNKGIPQGSAISAVLANVYMIEFDLEIINFLKNVNGSYFRYSDDFIIIFPSEFEMKKFSELKNKIEESINKIPNLELQEEKKQFFYFKNNRLKKINKIENPNKKVVLNYLGFSFDGEKITIRDKTISKYYYRMYNKIKTINKCIKNSNGITKNGNRISCKKLYENYSLKGGYNKNKKIFKGNFIHYVKRAEKIFGIKNSKYISHLRKIHFKKIKQKLKFEDIKR